METVSKLQAISLRLDQLDQTGEWLSECLAEIDNGAAQAGVMISALSEDIRLLMMALVTELESQIVAVERITQAQKMH
jgi:hypothetical protein